MERSNMRKNRCKERLRQGKTVIGAWLEEVRTATESSPEALFVVPGNHDVNRGVVSEASSLWELHQSLRKISSIEERLESLSKKLHDPFDFLAALVDYRAFAAELGCPTTAKALPWVNVLGNGKACEDGTRVRIHGLNSAILSDGKDDKANLLLGDFQFAHFDSDPQYVNVVLCHHPHSWLIDGNESNDYFRNQANIVLCGHEHDPRCYNEGRSVRVFAGAVHPNRRESRWEPCYHVLRLSMEVGEKRQLVVRVETRVWRDKDKCFGKYVQGDGSDHYVDRIVLMPWTCTTTLPARTSSTPIDTNSIPASDMNGSAFQYEFAAARRKLIVHFFRIGTLSRYEAAINAGVWEDGDDALDGQARWARVFDRAEKNGRLGSLWEAVAAKDPTLTGQPNPFTTKS
jgi:calcineurin-like phosphoesterase family protein